MTLYGLERVWVQPVDYVIAGWLVFVCLLCLWLSSRGRPPAPPDDPEGR